MQAGGIVEPGIGAPLQEGNQTVQQNKEGIVNIIAHRGPLKLNAHVRKKRLQKPGKSKRVGQASFYEGAASTAGPLVPDRSTTTLAHRMMTETVKKLDHKRTGGSLSKDHLGNSYLRNLDKIAQASTNRASALQTSASQHTKHDALHNRMRRATDSR